jgi:hypothetical protein
VAIGAIRGNRITVFDFNAIPRLQETLASSYGGTSAFFALSSKEAMTMSFNSDGA